MAGLSLTPEGAAEWRAHWPAIIAGMLGMALSSIHTYSAGAFVIPIEKDLGWSRAEIASGFTAAAITSALLAPICGVAVDRFGARALALPGVALYCLFFALISFSTGGFVQWTLAWAMVGFTAAFIQGTTWTTGIAVLFRSSRGLALAVILCGASVGSSVFPFLSTRFIAAFGWRGAYAGLGLTLLACVFPAVLFGFRPRLGTTQSVDQDGDGVADIVVDGPPDVAGPRPSALRALLSWRFLLLVVAAASIAGAVVPTSINLIPILVLRGYTQGFSAGIAALVGVFSIVGRLITGQLLDRYDPHRVGAIGTALPVIAFVLLAETHGLPLAIAGVIILGLSLGAEVDIIAYLVGRHFDLRIFGTVMGTLWAFLLVAIGSMPVYAGHIYDRTGSYHLFLLTCIPMVLLCSGLLFLLGTQRLPPALPGGSGPHPH
jgi:MFS family permease